MKIKGYSKAGAPTWVFELTSPMGGAAGEAYANTLAASDMLPEHVLAREAIQNSNDAAADSKKVRVQFRSTVLSGALKSQFVKAAGLEALADRRKALDLAEPNCLSSINAVGTALHVLYVDDYNTTGLDGNYRDDNSRFYRFLLSLGDGSKANEHGSGGSFGFGKSVYSSNSKIRTLFAYSRTVNEDGEPRSLLFGCSFFKKHRVKGIPYSGRAWNGVDETGGKGSQQRVVPLLDAKADELASRLGFAPRSKGELGTSVLVIDTDLSEMQILVGVENWWWPCLVANGIDVEVITASGEKLVPRPRKREHLRPFINAFDIANGTAEPKGGSARRKEFQKAHGLAMGTCALKVLEKTADEAHPYPIEDELLDSVALIRKPKMVVHYFRKWQVGSPALAGVYIASDDIDDFLKLSEPPQHSVWDPNSVRLRDAKGANREVAKEIVDSVLRRIRSEVKSFQKAASPPPPPKTTRLTILERALAKVFSPTKAGGGGNSPDKEPAPINLQYEKEPYALDGGSGTLKTCATFSVKLKPDAEEEKIKVRVKIECAALADGDEKGDDIPVTTKVSGLPVKPSADDPSEFIFPLQKGEVVRFATETGAYDSTWSVKFVPLVESVA